MTCIIVENEEDVAAFKNYVDDSPTTKGQPPPVQSQTTPSSVPPKSNLMPSPPPTAAPVQSSPSFSVPTFKNTDRIFASPLAKKLAAEQGADLSVCCFLKLCLSD